MAGKRKKKVVLYGSDSCHFCAETKKFLDGKGIPYTYRSVDGNEKAAREMLRKNGGKLAVPTVVIGKAVVVGFDPKKIEEAWR